jgi:hypothetical protein
MLLPFAVLRHTSPQHGTAWCSRAFHMLVSAPVISDAVGMKSWVAAALGQGRLADGGAPRLADVVEADGLALGVPYVHVGQPARACTQSNIIVSCGSLLQQGAVHAQTAGEQAT